MTFKRIPDEYQIATAFGSPTWVADTIPCALSSVRGELAKLGVSMVNVGGKSMVYRYELMEALERRANRPQQVQQPQQAQA